MKKLAAILTTASLLTVPFAHADDWGCEVLLCLSNPNGATAVSECVPPIKKLWKELAKGHAFPTCVMGGAGNSANLSNEVYPLCDEGYEVLSNGSYATTKKLFAENKLPNGNVSNNIPVYSGSELKGVYSGGQNGQLVYPAKVCIKKPVTATFTQNYNLAPNCSSQCGGTQVNRTVAVVEDIKSKSAYQGGYTVDVYIEGKLFKRVNSNSEE